ncbi:septation protein A [Thauera aromatica]|uniref:Inner membrane-spanning protein YciB n=1 Tax=Thauera aromatica K172 TaxID=44139 RepID=A0A2R4BNH0_THAAR|nr:septation protein A [Thauera aromatica]AVR88878.1 Intracellular septation protein IspA [Thauera aromatica K172]
MKFLFDLLPVILFFAAYKLGGAHPEAAHALLSGWLGDGIAVTQAPILIATAVAIAATALQIALVWLRHRKVDTMLWVSLAIITVFGGATLFFHNPTFIKWKPTALYWLFGCVLLGSAALLHRNLIRNMLEAQIRLPDPVWGRLNLAWASFFIAMGLLNLYVAYNFSEETWVDFKLFGGIGLMLAFVLGQGFYLSRHLEEESH